MQAHAELYKRALQYALADSISACRALRAHLQQKQVEYTQFEKVLLEAWIGPLPFIDL